MGIRKYMVFALMLLLPITANATIETNIAGENVTISVELGDFYKNRNLTVEVFLPGYSINDLKDATTGNFQLSDENMVKKVISNIWTVTTDSNGEFSFSYQPNNVRGLYKIRIGGERIYTPLESFFSFSNENDVELIMESITASTATLNDFKALFTKFESLEIFASYQILGLDKQELFPYFEANQQNIKDSIIERMFNNRKSIKVEEDVVDLFLESVFWHSIGNLDSGVQMDQFLEKYAEFGNMENEIFYKDIYLDKNLYEEATKKALLDQLKGALYHDKDKQQALDYFHDMLLVTMFTKTESYSAIASAINADKEYLIKKGMDFSNYDQGDIKRVRDVQSKRPFASINSFVAAFNQVFAAKAQTTAPTKSTQGGGSTVKIQPAITQATNVSQPTNTTQPTKPPEHETQTVDPDYIQASFKDLENVPWAKEAIVFLAGKNIINGKGDELFDPDAQITRGEFAKIITLAFALPDGAISNFNDVQSDQWFAPFVYSVCQSGVMVGFGDEFGVYTPITRQDMVTVLYRLISPVENEEFPLTFKDEQEISDYAKKAVGYFVNYGIVNGLSEDVFAPNDGATRAQVARLIYLIINSSFQEEVVK